MSTEGQKEASLFKDSPHLGSQFSLHILPVFGTSSGKCHIALLSLLALVWLTRVLCLDWALHSLTNDLHV